MTADPLHGLLNPENLRPALQQDMASLQGQIHHRIIINFFI
jgi:hypothetical protein